MHQQPVYRAGSYSVDGIIDSIFYVGQYVEYTKYDGMQELIVQFLFVIFLFSY